MPETDGGTPWYPVISTDSHLREPRTLYQDRLPKHLRERGPRVESLPEGDRIMIGDTFVRWVGIEAQEDLEPSERNYKGARYEIGRKGQLDPEARKYDLASDDVQGEVVYGFLFWMSHPDREVVHAMTRVYNDWGAEAYADVADRTDVVPMLPSWDPGLAVEELQRVRGKHRAVQVAWPYVGDVEYGYANPEYDRLWAACQDLDVPVTMHIGSGTHQARHWGPGATMHDFMDAFLDVADYCRMFISAGIFDRFPRLRIVGTEGGIGWAPYLLNSMDKVYEEFGSYLYPKLKRSPREYFQDNCLVTWMEDEPGVRCLDMLGDSVAWGNDYPHAEGTFPHSRASIRKQLAHLPLERQVALCAGNAARAFGFDVEELARRYGPDSEHHRRYSVHDGGSVSPKELQPVVTATR